MKSVTEFAVFTLNQGLKTRADLTAAGKNPEEILAGLGESFKFEGDKLKHFAQALDVAGQNVTNLKRVIVVTLAEGEQTPPKSTKVEETCYIPDFYLDPKAAPKFDARSKGKGGGRGGRGGGNDKKSSPWGLSPEEKAAKKGGPKAAKPN